MIGITDHAKKRAKERLNLSNDALIKVCALAYCYGKQMADTKGILLKYLRRREQAYPGSEFRIYGENIFIFRGQSLVTVHALPKGKNKKNFFNNEKIRNKRSGF